MSKKSKMTLSLLVMLLFSALNGTVLAGETITMVSQDYVEPQILCEMAKALIEKGTDLTIDHRRNFSGSSLVHQAVAHGDADIYATYTGTQFAGVLGMEVTAEWKDREKVLRYVQKEFAKRFDLKWYEPFGFNNTYALAVRKETADKLGLKKVSDLIPYAKDMVIATDQTFKERIGDGFYDLVDTYDLDFKKSMAMAYGLLYRAVNTGDVDVAVAYSTDGRIASMNLVTLEDDKGFFPPYDASLVISNRLLKKYPVIDELVQPLIGSITEAEMQRVNSWVDVDGLTVEEAAHKYLTEKGLL